MLARSFAQVLNFGPAHVFEFDTPASWGLGDIGFWVFFKWARSRHFFLLQISHRRSYSKHENWIEYIKERRVFAGLPSDVYTSEIGKEQTSQ